MANIISFSVFNFIVCLYMIGWLTKVLCVTYTVFEVMSGLSDLICLSPDPSDTG